MASIYLRTTYKPNGSKVKGKTWWIKYYQNGKAVCHSLNTTSRTIARFKKNKIENEIAVGDSPVCRKKIIVSDLLKEYKENLKITVRQRTVEYYTEILTPFVKSLPKNAQITSITDKAVTDYINSKKSIAPGMVWHIIKVIKTFLNFAVKRKYLSSNPVTMRKPTLPKRTPECWTKEEVKRILESAQKTGDYSPIYLNLHIGLRPSELYNLEWDDINFKSETLTVRGTKDSEDRKIFLHPNAISEFKKIRKADTQVFPDLNIYTSRTVARRVRNGAKMPHIERFWYAIRHTFATEYYKQTEDLRGLQEILGHSKIEMTTVYVNPQEDYMRRKLATLSYEIN